MITTTNPFARLIPMKQFLLPLAMLLIGGMTSSCFAQPEAAGPEYDIFKKDVGEWDAVVKAWAGPGEPQVTKGSESSRMMGDFWVITDFKGNMFGFDFLGHGVYGYDKEKGKYVGTWCDSLGPAAMHMVGEYDKATETVNYVGDSVGPDGQPATYFLSTCYKDNKRVMTMHYQSKSGGEKTKMMEMTYTKKAKDN